MDVSERDLLKKLVADGRGTGDGPDDEHEVEEIEYADDSE